MPIVDYSNEFLPADQEHVKRERTRAKALRHSQWWKNLRGRGLCLYCNKNFHPHDLTMDHVVPIIRGGMTKKSNIVACCEACNKKKKYLLPIEWDEYLQSLAGDQREETK